MPVLLLSAPAALADTIDLTLTNPIQAVEPGVGGTLSYFATVSAPITNTGIENLNADEFSVSFSTTLDDSTGFQSASFPLDLNPGDRYTGLLFTITVPSTDAAGVYPGTFSILGGATVDSLDMLATVDYDAVVTPEPTSLLLLGTGLAGLAAALGGRRKISLAKRT